MDKRTTWKRIGSLFLTLAMVLTMSVTALPVYAAGQGSISIVYNPHIEGLSNDYHIYKVADFGRYDADEGTTHKKGDVKLVPVEALSGLGVDLNAFTTAPSDMDIDSEEYITWEDKWLKAASQIENKIIANQSLFPDVKTDPEGKLVAKEGKQSLGTYDNGIYLISTEFERVGDKNWKSVPVLVMVLNGETTFSIADFNGDTAMRYNEVKMTSKDVIYKHEVVKKWVNAPTATQCNVRAKILYGEGENQQAVDVVDLKLSTDPEQPQSYVWYSTESEITKGENKGKTQVNYYKTDPEGVENAKPDKTFIVDKPGTWFADEMRETAAEKDALKYFTTSVTYSADKSDDQSESSWNPSENSEEQISITNTFQPAQLTINKNLASYLNQTSANAVVAFEVTGTIDGLNEPAYHNKVSVVFDNPGQKGVTLNNLPANLDSITVKEIYSTNYTVTGRTGGTTGEDGYSITIESPTGEDSVSFTNAYDPNTPPTHSSGIVNTYKDGGEGFKIIDRDKGQSGNSPTPAEH